MSNINIPWGELMKYRNSQEVGSIYNYPVFKHEFPLIISEIGNKDKVIDFGCGDSKIYNQALLPSGYEGIFVGIDPDPDLLAVSTFPIYATVQEFKEQNFKVREFDTLLMLNSAEHLSAEELYMTLKELNPYIDGKLIIMTPNPKCFDYLFGDPQHKTFYDYQYLYGLFKHFDFPNIKILRGKGIYQIREEAYKQDQRQTHLMEMNDLQRKVSIAFDLDWYGNLLVIGERSVD